MTAGRIRNASLVAAGILAVAVFATAEEGDAVAYPAQFRSWAHVKSTLVGPQSPGFAANGGLHHFYANAKGVEGYRTGAFPDGAVLVDDLLETKDTATPGVTSEGPRRRLAVMVKDSQRFAKTGGWGFEVFPGDTQTASLNADGRAACFACHQKAKNAVYSELRK
jgi:cytochrome c551/c552